MRKHAMLSASGASRWIVCTPSPRFEAELAERDSSYADEGTLAHELSIWLIRHKLWGVGIKRAIKDIIEDPLYNDEMWDYCSEYADFVATRLRAAPKGAQLVLEQRLDLVDFIPEGFGTTDVCIVADDVMEVIDFKYGKGVPVEAYENKQMMVYGLGALKEYQLLFNIKKVIMTIYQPRINNIDSYEITAHNLLRWGYDVLRTSAIKAYQGLGDYIAGDHCRFCRARSVCKAQATYHVQLAKQEFDVKKITDEQMTKLLLQAKALKSWITSVEQYALEESVKHGKVWPGMKVVIGRSNRKYQDEDKVRAELMLAGYKEEEIMKPAKLVGLTEMQATIGAKDFDKYVAPHLEKPPGKPALVSVEDQRPEWNSTQAAALEFDEEDDNN